MAKVKDVVNALIYHAGKLSESAGPATSAFDRLHMEEIRKVETEVLGSDRADAYLASLRKLLTHHNRSVRWRGVFLLGELMRSHLDSKEVDRCVKELIRCIETEICFRPVNTVGREVVNALGKSRSPSAESPVLQLLGNRETRSIRPNILVTVGKIGGSISVEVLTEFMKTGDLKDSDRMYISWAMGRLGSVQDNTRPQFPLPRGLFERPLARLLKTTRSSVKHPDVHYYTIYAIGEICDQRDTALLTDSVAVSTLERAENTLALIGNRRSEIIRSIGKYRQFKGDPILHFQRLSDISTKVALKMIRGQTLDREGERILLDARILLEARVERR